MNFNYQFRYAADTNVFLQKHLPNANSETYFTLLQLIKSKIDEVEDLFHNELLIMSKGFSTKLRHLIKLDSSFSSSRVYI
jgi:hypothetical protein